MRIVAYEVGIRISNRERAIAFHAALGFHVTESLPEHDALELTNDPGIVLNLLLNGAPRANASNVLVDEPLKLPGVTHATFVLPDLEEMITALHEAGIPLSDGPVEFDELKDDRRSL